MVAKGLTLVMVMMLSGIIAGCSSVASLPAGTASVNTDNFESREDLFEKLSGLNTGMSREKVFETIGKDESEMLILSRNQTVMALYGTPNIEIPNATKFLSSLQGYSFDYKKVDRSTGFSSPVSMRTKHTGYHYNITLVFKDNKLYEEPIISGGDVEDSNSKTIFEYISPGRVVGAAF